MMEEELGKGSDDDDDDDDDDEGLPESDEDDFYKAIKLKNKAKKEAKQQMYAVAPKYPRLDIEVDGALCSLSYNHRIFFLRDFIVSPESNPLICPLMYHRRACHRQNNIEESGSCCAQA